MAANINENYGALLRQYRLTANHVEDFGRVKKVHTNSGVFALKKLSEANSFHFPKVIQALYNKGFTRAVPIIPTANGHHVIQYQNDFYYLMPWFENETRSERDEKHNQLFRELARMHFISSKEAAFEENDISHHYEAVKKKWDESEALLEQFIEKSENKWYMSPFELQACTIFHETTLATRFAKDKLYEWKDAISEKEKFRTVITHGKVSVKHFLFDEKGHGYFNNFERTGMASPINDLVSFYYRTLRTYPALCNDCFEWYQTYSKHFPLKKEEVLLFLSYLTYPEATYRCVSNYITNKNSKSEREHVQLLQKAYWLNKNIEYFALKVMQEMQYKEEQEEQEESHT